MKYEMIPRPLNGDVFYSILRKDDGIEEKNPMILFYRLTSARD
jgi:hypothetical protein